jgi:hypothetical protein
MKWYKITVPLSVGGNTGSAAGGSSIVKTAEDRNAGMKRPGEIVKRTPDGAPEAKPPETEDNAISERAWTAADEITARGLQNYRRAKPNR